MRTFSPGALRGLALGLAAGAQYLSGAGPMPVPNLPAIRALEPQRAAQAIATFRTGLGFQGGEDLAVHRAFTNDQGRTVVRMSQTFEGHRVYGTEVVGHVEPDGTLKLAVNQAQPGLVPEGQPTLSAAQATAIAVRQAGLKGHPLPPKVEQVVFPTAQTDGLTFAADPSTRTLGVDRTYSVLGGRPSGKAVWAYQVDVFTKNQVDGVVDMQLIIDARTGAVLKKLNNLKAAEARPRVLPSSGAPQRLSSRPLREGTPEVLLAGVPAEGTGLGQYVGRVPVSATQQADGTFVLRDGTRGSKPNPYFLKYENAELTGITTLWENHELSMENWGRPMFYVGKPTNSWGDGFPFMDAPHEADTNGETAAVDAHFGLGLTWDMYRKVFGREGLDGQGTSPFALVHMRNSGTGMKFDNAFWSDNLFGMFFGDGTYFPDTLVTDDEGRMRPGNPYGMMSLTELDIAAHEISHGLTFASAGLRYRGESGGLNEASSDIMGTLAEAYFARRAGEDDTIPNVGTDWVMGSKTRPCGPLRFMKKPSRDFLSADNWYEGLNWMEVHYSSGPMNRCFYYLSQGAPTSSSDEAYSPYLPGGMDGIGNDHAGRIYFKALTEYMTPSTDYHEAAACLVKAATDLYGASSADVRAVKQAFTAINVQVAGEPKLAQVTFPVVNTDGVLGQDPGDMFSRLQILPMGARVALKAAVLNQADQAVTWKVGAHRAAIDTGMDADTTGVGVLHEDGTWTAPLRAGVFFMTAFNKTRPEQYAEGLTFIQDLDADGDAVQDAMDMGATAFSWFLSKPLKASHSPYGGQWVDDLDVTLFQAAIKNAWGAK